MLRRKSYDTGSWVDFRKIREIELGIKKPPTKAEILIRTYSNGDSNSGGESSGTDWTVSEELSTKSRGTDSGMNSVYSTLERKSRSVKREGKPIARRSLLHSFERPARDVNKFVAEALGFSNEGSQYDSLKYESAKYDSSKYKSCDSGLELDYASLPRKIKNIAIDDSHSDDSAVSTNSSGGHSGSFEGHSIGVVKRENSKGRTNSKGKNMASDNNKERSRSKTKKKEKRARFADFETRHHMVSYDQGYHGLSGNQIQSGNRIRSTSLDRNRLGTRSMSIFSVADSDCRSSDGISSEIFHSDLNEYRGNMAAGVRPKPKLRMTHYRGMISRHDDLMKNFNRRQRETINRVEYVFEKSNRQIETALIDMKIELACKRT